MKATRIGIVVLVVASVLAACWFANEDRKSAHRINVPSHQKRVGLGFRHERNDMVGFVLRGPVMLTPTQQVAQ